MWSLTILAEHISVNWHLLPLAVVISLVYSASRYEFPERIVRRAARLFMTIMFFMAAVFCVLWALSFNQ